MNKLKKGTVLNCNLKNKKGHLCGVELVTLKMDCEPDMSLDDYDKLIRTNKANELKKDLAEGEHLTEEIVSDINAYRFGNKLRCKECVLDLPTTFGELVL